MLSFCSQFMWKHIQQVCVCDVGCGLMCVLNPTPRLRLSVALVHNGPILVCAFITDCYGHE